jgi:mono/diheme cytochrome c family protein
VDRAVLERGRSRYNIYCAPCHDRVGNGDGMEALRGYRQPPSLHIDRLRQAPVGHYFDVMTNGLGAMPDYAAQIAVHDRWAVIAYIRALQLSQRATTAEVPPEDLRKLEQPKP